MRTMPPFAAVVLVACAAAFTAVAAAPDASAHDAPELRIHAQRTGDRLRISIEADAAALAHPGAADRATGTSDARRLEAAVAAAASDGRPLPLRMRATGAAAAILEGDAPSGDVILSLSLFGSDDPGEAVVRLEVGRDERLLRVELPGIVRLAGGSATATSTSSTDVLSFVRSGVAHILGGFDHLAFLAVLVVVGRRLRDVLAVATAFTLAHSLTLTLSALDLVRVPEAPVEAVIAASIVLAALGNVVAGSPRHRAAFAFGFGLVHGLGFASGLAGMLDGARVSRLGAVLGFNLGVELGQLAVLLAATPLLLAWRRRAPRAYALVGVRATSIAIAGLGLVWLAQRTLP